MGYDNQQHNDNKFVAQQLSAALYNFDNSSCERQLGQLFHADSQIRLGHPIGDLTGSEAFYQQAILPLYSAIPDLERRDYIRIAGYTEDQQPWVGCAGYYTGVMTSPWLDIPPSGHQVSMRFHEFYRIEEGKIIEMQGLWDIVDVMRQSNAWPMTPSLGHEWHVPGPATNDGIVAKEFDAVASKHSEQRVINMLLAMQRYPRDGGPEVMQMDKFWHPKMNWYGPAGIGTGRGIAGFRHWHQIPFITAMPDRGQDTEGTQFHFIADHNYVGVTGWPNMKQTLNCDGWLGIAPANKQIALRSLDFWRIENDLIRENWVLIDLPDIYRQLGVDVFARLREFNKARVPGSVNWPLPG